MSVPLAVAVGVDSNSLHGICPVVELPPEKSEEEFQKLLKVNRATGRVVITSTTHFLVRTGSSEHEVCDALEKVQPIWGSIVFAFDLADVHHVRGLFYGDDITLEALVFNPTSGNDCKVNLAGAEGVSISLRETTNTRFTCIDIIARNGWNAVEMTERVGAVLIS
jgi:hypothetical protein